MHSTLFTPLSLPCGATLPNRFAKAAMEENMAIEGQVPGRDLFDLYRNWSLGGTGLLITGNVMVDARAMTGPGGVALERNTALAPFYQWAEAAHSGESQIWMQINHPGRQVIKALGGLAIAPSAIPVNIGKHSGLFDKPTAMTETQIANIIQRFAHTAALAHQTGFDGVQIHAAHGYLLSQFLSPLTNVRTDNWGGSLANRARLLLAVVKAVRVAVPNQFAVSVKLNSSDFQKGGFSTEEAQQVVLWLNDLNVDLIELSGGSYEAPAMQGQARDGTSLDREAYFLSFARDIAAVSKTPIMTTGGIRRKEIAESVIGQGIAMIGIATALAMNPHLVKQWQSNIAVDGVLPEVRLKDKSMAALARMALVKRQLRRIGKNQKPLTKMSPLFTLIIDQLRSKRLTTRYRRWCDLEPYNR